jgi:two-component system, NarL family, response regulator LiaR
MSNKSKIRVLVADDHQMVRVGLSAMLMAHDDLELVGEAANGVEALRLCDHLRPDIVLLDLSMPLLDGLATLRILRERSPDIKVLVFTSFTETHLIEDVLKAGAMGYVLKNASTDELARAIRAVYQGDPILAPEVTDILIHTRIHPRSWKVGDDLTKREREVLRLIASGMDNASIAKTLTITPATVKFHVSQILSKLNVSTRTEAMLYALEHNLISGRADESPALGCCRHDEAELGSGARFHRAKSRGVA